MGITRERAVEIARHGGGDPVPVRFAPMTNRQLLIRLITNQASRARSGGDTARALRLYERMTLIAPRLTSLWWERARLEQVLGHNQAARASLTAMLETTHEDGVDPPHPGRAGRAGAIEQLGLSVSSPPRRRRPIACQCR